MESHPIKKSNVLEVKSQRSRHFEDLTSLQYGWDFTVSQLGPSDDESVVQLYKTPNVGYNRFWYATAYDQRLHSKKGFMSFGLLETDNPATWTYDQLIPNDAVTVFPSDDDLKAASPIGFCGNGIHISLGLMNSLAEEVYRRPLDLLIPGPGMYMPGSQILDYLRLELQKWRSLESFSAEARAAIIARREETLALAIMEALVDKRSLGENKFTGAKQSMSQALDFIHGTDLENISALELCRQAECSQRTLEKSFKKKLGVTPKKYIKYLRLARVYKELRESDGRGNESIIQLAGAHGFWHMGQFAADYRGIYGELPSETLKR